MKLPKKGGVVALVCGLVASAFLLTSCSSYRVCGFVPLSSGNRSERSGQRYRISSLRFNQLNGNLDIRYVFTQAVKCPERDLIAQIQRQRPDVFSNDPTAFPIDVNVSMTSSRIGGQATILLYIFSLCTLPFCEERSSEGFVSVRPAETAPLAKAVEKRIRFRSDQKFTFYSPIGLISYEDYPGADVTRKRSGPFSARPDDLQYVFVKTAADAIAQAVREMKPAVPKRAATAPEARRISGKQTPGPAKPAATAADKTARPVPAKPKAEKPKPPEPQERTCPKCGALLGDKKTCPLCD